MPASRSETGMVQEFESPTHENADILARKCELRLSGPRVRHMARLARVVLPGLAHHFTQRVHGRQRMFFFYSDYARYLRLITAACLDASVTCLAFCLKRNRAHPIPVPAKADGLCVFQFPRCAAA